MSTSTVTREVVVASAATNVAKKFMTSARTWGELKQEVSRQGLSLNNVEAILNPGKLTLNRDESELPDTNFKVYLVPTKNKAGISPREAETLSNALTQAIVKAAKMATEEKIRELKTELIETIEQFFEVDLDDNDFGSNYGTDDNDDSPEDADLREARRLM